MLGVSQPAAAAKQQQSSSNIAAQTRKEQGSHDALVGTQPATLFHFFLGLPCGHSIVGFWSCPDVGKASGSELLKFSGGHPVPKAVGVEDVA